MSDEKASICIQSTCRKRDVKPRLSDVLDIFVKAGYEVTVHPTQAYRDAYYQIKEYEVGKYDLIACSGGDGTIDEVATGMMKRREMGKDVVPVGIFRQERRMICQESAHSEKTPCGSRQCGEGSSISVRHWKFNDSVFRLYCSIWNFYRCVLRDRSGSEKCTWSYGVYIGRCKENL